MEEIVTVGLGDRSYPVRVGTGTLTRLGELCRAAGMGKRAAVITNATVGALYLPVVKDALVSAGFELVLIEVADGEQYKNSDTLNAIYDRLIDGGLTRDGFVVALGGGVVGDMAGYAAATYLRGIPFVQVPTTLLAQVDSSVGGKTGINHLRGKNLIGAFHQPCLVLVDTDTLSSLPEREYLAGLAEVVKYGVALDRAFFEFLEANVSPLLRRDPDILRKVIAGSCALKAGVVEQDEREGGLRAVLNYGHTLGHAVETLTGYREYLHGEAVAIGMARAARLSASYGYASEADAERVERLLAALNLPVALPSFPQSAYLDALLKDKKRRDQGLNFVFNKGIGGFAIATVARLDDLLVRCGVGVGGTVEAALTGIESMDADEEIHDLTDDCIVEELEEVVEDEWAVQEESDTGQAPVISATMAELYVKQGFNDLAIGVYRQLVAQNPMDTALLVRLDELLAWERSRSEGPQVEIAVSPAIEPIPFSGTDVAVLDDDGPELRPALQRQPLVATLEGWLATIGRMKECRSKLH